ncbi:HAD-IA family hydrolase [Aurantimonas sp. Leaf443]|uniref:HAD-IA family hydrolase n=1 Tax=Aurantimonas sp. Leaf443 TaxID=1736378 RepID=UPI0006F66980|nr:HAD-IA family hydrolase [Aurantimonas sp. Leaf443]KQT85745.1 hypothetical protein ASG48_03750 [Aurantimonas sp. Leaf443]
MTALIFDVDGTLAETEELHRRAFNEAFAAEGLGWHWDEYRYKDLLAVTGGKERMHHFIERETIALKEPAESLVPRLHAAKTALYARAVEAGALDLRDGILDLVTAAKAAGVRLAIATTTTRGNVEALLANTPLGAAASFEVMVCGDEVRAKKPAPDVYRRALELLALDASQALAVEDTANGLAAATAAGLRCVVVPSRYSRDEDFAGAELVLERLGAPQAVLRLLTA